MAKSFKFKNSNYLDSNSIVYGRTTLKSRLDRLGYLRCITESTQDFTYVDIDLQYDENNVFDRRIYMYSAIGNNMQGFAGFFTYQNGNLIKVHKLFGDDMTLTQQSKGVIRFDLGTNWGSVTLITIFPK